MPPTAPAATRSSSATAASAASSARACRRQGLPFVVIEQDRRRSRSCAARGVAGGLRRRHAPGVLEAARVGRARLIMVATPDGYQHAADHRARPPAQPGDRHGRARRQRERGRRARAAGRRRGDHGRARAGVRPAGLRAAQSPACPRTGGRARRRAGRAAESPASRAERIARTRRAAIGRAGRDGRARSLALARTATTDGEARRR